MTYIRFIHSWLNPTKTPKNFEFHENISEKLLTAQVASLVLGENYKIFVQNP